MPQRVRLKHLSNQKVHNESALTTIVGWSSVAVLFQRASVQSQGCQHPDDRELPGHFPLAAELCAADGGHRAVCVTYQRLGGYRHSGLSRTPRAATAQFSPFPAQPCTCSSLEWTHGDRLMVGA